jgi:hypothetical protein
MTCIDGIWGQDKMHRWPNHHPLPEINQGVGPTSSSHANTKTTFDDAFDQDA